MNKLSKKILIVIPYFGPLPPWFDYFLLSCANNSSINWLLVSDQTYSGELPENVSMQSSSFGDYCQKVSDKLDIGFSPSSPYKLCDLKPALGLIHEEECHGYDFWGFGDIDLIYGDLQGFISAEMLEKNLISFHDFRVSGHLCLLKNTEQMRHAFTKYKKWREILSDPEHRCFDEKHFNAIFIKHKNWPKWQRDVVYFYNYYMRTAHFVEAYSTSFAFVPWVDGSFDFPEQWRFDGKITTDDDKQFEIPYLHFMVWKRQWSQGTVFEADSAKGRWLINEKGFFNS